MIPKSDELLKIYRALFNVEENPDLSNVEMTFYVNHDTLRKLNEEFFYRNNPEAKMKTLDNADEIRINVGDLNVLYKTK